MQIEKYIPTGKDNAVHLQDLALKLGITTTSVKANVRSARKRNIPILSGSEGYWISTIKEEIEAFSHTMDKQAKSRFDSTKLLKRRLKNIEGQIGMFNNADSDQIPLEPCVQMSLDDYLKDAF